MRNFIVIAGLCFAILGPQIAHSAREARIQYLVGKLVQAGKISEPLTTNYLVCKSGETLDSVPTNCTGSNSDGTSFQFPCVKQRCNRGAVLGHWHLYSTP